MSFEPVVSLTEQIADHIGGEIISGRLKPATRIQELKVAGDLKVSRGSVREALLILERRHLIEIIPRRGAIVSRLEAQEVSNFCELFTDLQVSLFVKLARLKKLDPSRFAATIEAISEGVNAAEIDRVLTGRAMFLQAGFAQIENFYLCSVLGGLIPAGQRLAHRVSRNPAYEPRDTLRYHQALLDAMLGHDAERVEELVRAYNGREQKLALGCSDRAPAAAASGRPVVKAVGR